MVYGLMAAILFGASAPLSKLLLARIDPIPLAGLLYVGAGASMGLWAVVARLQRSKGRREARLERTDLPWLLGAVLAGGIVGPILLLFGLRATPASTASLLLNFEAAATALIAVSLFKESVGRSIWWAVVAITVGGVFLSLDLTGGWGISAGALLILGACLMWGFDNNFTQRISLRDPTRIVMVKGLAAGSFSLGLAAALGRPLPGGWQILAALAVGGVSYGMSIMLFVLSLRRLGAARTGALFGVAPFAGVLLSLAIFPELPEWTFFAALPLMLLAAALLSREQHEHLHRHASMTHTHAHRHTDPHHQHAHDRAVVAEAVHAHRHTHAEIEHTHPHKPDVHHRHEHPSGDPPP